MEGKKERDPAKWLQARKDLVALLAEAKATKRKITEETLQKVFSPIQEKAEVDLLPSQRSQ